MSTNVRRIYVEKKECYAVAAKELLSDLRDNLGIKALTGLRIINCYDIAGISDEEYKSARNTIFSEPNVDITYDEDLCIDSGSRVFAIEYLPGQYDQRADSAAQCLQILIQKERPLIVTSKLFVLQGNISENDFTRIKEYCINPLESREIGLEKRSSLELEYTDPQSVPVIEGFIDMNRKELESLLHELGLAMSFKDLEFCQMQFRDIEKRNPTLTELRVIDTYWSDHCRHTTFLTHIENIEIEEGRYKAPIINAFDRYMEAREYVYEDAKRDISLMDIALIAMKELKKKGFLEDLDTSDEINACSIKVDVDVNGEKEEWLLMFKNETHNHPTEIEPFGGAATCLGGAIRDPLSGRAYVYGAMRVTGSGDPRTAVEATLPGKLPQRKITTGAAEGYSSYGNQIGLAAGQIAEVYDEGFVAKRMEIGAVIGAVPKNNVVRRTPEPGDVVILLGGRTGRDGCGGATGSSKEHTEDSLLLCGAEVQKGNPPTERKIQRLFRKAEVTRLIKKCNDFGAGGVSVAIGELADSLEIYLDLVPKKYEGLDGTELAISESQERMAVLVAPEDAGKFVEYAAQENLEAVVVAKVTADGRLRMHWKNNEIVNISRKFLDTNGVKQSTTVFIESPDERSFFQECNDASLNSWGKDLEAAWLNNLRDLNVCSQKGLVERFDSTIGGGTLLMPFGGKYQQSPSEGLAMKIPVQNGDTKTASIMCFGYNPKLSKWSPFHGALYAVVESAAKIVALGGDYRKTRLTLQEYFEKLGSNPKKWGKPVGALLGAFYAQVMLEIPAIGGKDSMSGTFKDLNVPPTLVSFAVNTVDADRIVSQEFKKSGSKVVVIKAERDDKELPDFCELKRNFEKVHELIEREVVLSSTAVRYGGIAASISRMCFGNKIGFKFDVSFDRRKLFTADYGSIILEVGSEQDLAELMSGVDYEIIGMTQQQQLIEIGEIAIELEAALTAWSQPLERIFPVRTEDNSDKLQNIYYDKRNVKKPSIKVGKPRVLIPVFPGTNCEYDMAKAFEKAGGKTEMLVFRNLTPSDIEASIDNMVKAVHSSQIIAIPGGFSAGDEPDGSGKFIAAVFRNPKLREAVMKFLKERDGLILGICNGFQALIKLGLLPWGEIRDIEEDSPTLTFNKIGRHVSCMVRTKVISTMSPWFSRVNAGDIHTIPVSHGEGRFVANKETIEELIRNGQIATQYVDFEGNPTYDIAFNPNGSIEAVEGITSPDGRILGKMGHSERIGRYIAQNIPGEKDQKIFESGIDYFS